MRKDTLAALRLVAGVMRSRLFLLLLAIDALLITVHMFVATRPWETPQSPIEYLRIDKDKGLAEWFEYGLLAAALVCAILSFRATRRSYFLFVAALLGYFLVDDAFGLHELGGRLLDSAAPELGEIVPSAIAGSLLFCWGLFELIKSPQADRPFLMAVALITGYIAFFGVFVDAFHGHFIAPHSLLDGPMTVIEDGNELVGISLFCALMVRTLPLKGGKTLDSQRRGPIVQ